MDTTPAPASPTDGADLAAGELDLLGLLPGSSNYTFLARLGDSGNLVVYKPRRGESPLWDFPQGTLCQREAAAFVVCTALGWSYVPATILRDGPHGTGMVQQYIEHDPKFHAFNLTPEHDEELKQIAVFDLIVNNADRKGGHVLREASGPLRAIDHGVCFHAEPKLRTVLWDYIGDPVPEDTIAAVEALCGAVEGEIAAQIGELLLPEEIDALLRRAQAILKAPVFPEPGPGRPYPWPPI
ncbi:MAG: SCO1664 family protein [Actinomycetota bacterium]